MSVYNLIQIKKIYDVRWRAQIQGDRDLSERDSSFGYIHYGDANLMVVNGNNVILSQYRGARVKASTNIEKVNTLAKTCIARGMTVFQQGLAHSLIVSGIQERLGENIHDQLTTTPCSS